jgi:hypothetical protein
MSSSSHPEHGALHDRHIAALNAHHDKRNAEHTMGVREPSTSTVAGSSTTHDLGNKGAVGGAGLMGKKSAMPALKKAMGGPVDSPPRKA